MSDTERPAWEPAPGTEPPPPRDDTPGPFARLLLAFTSPGKLFDATARRPRWAVCLLALILVSLAANFVTTPHLDFEATIRERAEQSGREIDDARIEQMVKMSERMASFGPVFVVVGTPLMMGLFALVFLAGAKVAGSDCDYSRSLAVTVHSYWAPWLVLNGLMIILVQRVDKIPATALQNLVKGSVGAFLPAGAPAWQTALGSSLSIFNLWIIVLLVLGMSAVGRISRGAAATVVLVPWVLYVLGKTALTAALS